MKKILVILVLAVVLVTASLFVKKENVAQTADFTVEVENQKVKKSEEFTLRVKVNSIVNLSSIEAYLEYDAQSLEFVSSSKQEVVGTAGTLMIKEEFTNPVKETVYEITMKALEVGTSEITIENIYLEDETNSDIIEITQTSAVVNVVKNSEENSDASLSEIKIFPGSLSPKFESSVREYTVTVDSDVEELILSAQPSLKDSVVTIDQPEVLAYGENEISITVAAPSGNSKVYRILVTRTK